MPFVSGFLRIRGLGHPGQPLPPEEGGPVDPDYGVDVGDRPPFEKPLPEPPPGLWPPPVPSHPIVPVPPGVDLPPGMIWPPPGHPAHPVAPGRPPGQIAPPIAGPPSKFAVLVWIPGYGFKYVVVDASLKPTPA